MARRRRAVRAAGRLGLLAASLAVTLVAIELALRPFFHPTSSPLEHRIPHPLFGWRLEPGASYEYERIGFRVDVAYNHRGWRDLPRSFEKPEGIFRILVLGDSYMEAYSVELEEAFHRQLERELADGARRFEVINLGVGGFGTLQELLALRLEGLRYDPDLVLLAFNGNDPGNNSREFQTRYFGKNHMKVRSRPFLDPDSSEWVVDPPDYEAAMDRFEEELRRAAARPWWTRTSIAQLVDQAELDWWWSDLWERWSPRESDSPREVPCRERPEYDEVWRTTGRILARLQRLVEDHGAELLVFTVPKEHGRQEVTLHLRWRDGRRLRCRDPGYAPRLAGIVEEIGSHFLDLGPVFAAESGPDGKRLIRRGDGHWNPLGHRLAAERVAIALEERGLLPARSSPARNATPETPGTSGHR